jgi:predicted transcriptional regulator
VKRKTLTKIFIYDIMETKIRNGRDWKFMEGVQTRNGLYGFEFREVDERRVDLEDKKTYQIKQLWQRSHEIINLAAQGFKNVEIAEIVGVTPACVTMTLNSELGQKKLSDIRMSRDNDVRKTAEKIRVLTAKALQVYHEIFDNEFGEATLKDRKDTADTVVLELSGLRAPTKIHSTSVSTVLTAEEIQAFKDRAKKAATQSGMPIDVEPRNP